MACWACPMTFWVNSIFFFTNCKCGTPVKPYLYTSCAFPAYGNFDTDNFSKSRPSAESFVLLFPVNSTVKPMLIATSMPNLEREELCHIVKTLLH